MRHDDWGCKGEDIDLFRDNVMQNQRATNVRWLSCQATNQPRKFSNRHRMKAEGILIIIFAKYADSNVTKNHWGVLGINFDTSSRFLVGVQRVPVKAATLLKLNGIWGRCMEFRRRHFVGDDIEQAESECGARACVFAKWFVTGHAKQPSKDDFLNQVNTLMQQWRDLRSQ